MEDKFKEFIREEFLKEAAQIEEEVLKDKSVENLNVTPEMYKELLTRIQKIESLKRHCISEFPPPQEI